MAGREDLFTDALPRHEDFAIALRALAGRSHLVGAGVCLELSQLPAPEYLALVARTYEAVAS